MGNGEQIQGKIHGKLGINPLKVQNKSTRKSRINPGKIHGNPGKIGKNPWENPGKFHGKFGINPGKNLGKSIGKWESREKRE